MTVTVTAAERPSAEIIPATTPIPAAAPPPRRHVALVGTTFAVAAGVMLFGGLLASYFADRQAVHHSGGAWLDTKATPLPNVALAVSYLSLLMSSFTAQWAVSAIKVNDRRQGYAAVGLTLLLAAAFLNGMTFCWTQVHMGAGKGGFADHMYIITVTHVLVVIAAIVLLLIMGFRVLGGQFGPRNSEFVSSAVAFWHFAVVSGAAVWWCVWFLSAVPHRK